MRTLIASSLLVLLVTAAQASQSDVENACNAILSKNVGESFFECAQKLDGSDDFNKVPCFSELQDAVRLETVPWANDAELVVNVWRCKNRSNGAVKARTCGGGALVFASAPSQDDVDTQQKGSVSPNSDSSMSHESLLWPDQSPTEGKESPPAKLQLVCAAVAPEMNRGVGRRLLSGI